MRRPWPALGRSATEKKNYWILKIITVLTRCPYLSLLWARRIHPHLYILFLKITIHFPPIYASVFTGFSFLRKFRLQYYINYSFALLQLYSNWTGINIAWFVVHCCLLYTVVCCTLLFVVHCCLLYTVVCCTLLFVAKQQIPHENFYILFSSKNHLAFWVGRYQAGYGSSQLEERPPSKSSLLLEYHISCLTL